MSECDCKEKCVECKHEKKDEKLDGKVIKMSSTRPSWEIHSKVPLYEDRISVKYKLLMANLRKV